MVEAMHRALALVEGVGDLHRREAGDVPEDQNLALILGEAFQRLAQGPAAIERSLSGAGVGQPHLLGGNSTPRPQVVECGVPGHPEDPGIEGNLALFVLVDRRHQLGEDVLRDVFRLVMVADEARYISEYVIRITDVEVVKTFRVSGLGTSHSSLREIAVPAAQCAAHWCSPACSPHATSTGFQAMPPGGAGLASWKRFPHQKPIMGKEM